MVTSLPQVLVLSLENEILTNKHIVDAAHNNPDNLGVAPSSKSESEMPNGEFKDKKLKIPRKWRFINFKSTTK